MAEEQHLRDALDLACSRTTEMVVVDCSEISFADSSALNALVSAWRQLNARDCRLQLVKVPASMKRVLEIVKLWEHLDAHWADEPLDLHVDLALAWTDDAGLRVTFG